MKRIPFNHEEVPVIGDFTCDSLESHMDDFTHYSVRFNAAYLLETRGMVTALYGKINTRVYWAEMNAITKLLYAKTDQLREDLWIFEGYLNLAEPHLTVAVKEFVISEIRDNISAKNVEKILDNLNTCFTLIERNLTPLKAEGFTDDGFAALKTLKDSIRTDNNLQNAKINEKEEAVRVNQAMIQTLWDRLSQIIDVGKRLYKYSNSERYNDYVIKNLKSRVNHEREHAGEEEPPAPALGMLSGILTNKSNDQVLENVELTIIENQRVEYTDEDGQYDVDSLPVGTYSVKARLEGFKDVLILNVAITKDNTTTLNIQMEPNEPTEPEV
jgi:hypothetical protein